MWVCGGSRVQFEPVECSCSHFRCALGIGHQSVMHIPRPLCCLLLEMCTSVLWGARVVAVRNTCGSIWSFLFISLLSTCHVPPWVLAVKADRTQLQQNTSYIDSCETLCREIVPLVDMLCLSWPVQHCACKTYVCLGTDGFTGVWGGSRWRHHVWRKLMYRQTTSVVRHTYVLTPEAAFSTLTCMQLTKTLGSKCPPLAD